MTLKTIRNGIHKIDTYLNAALDLFGGDDGLCHYTCSDGKLTCWHIQTSVILFTPVLLPVISSQNERDKLIKC